MSTFQAVERLTSEDGLLLDEFMHRSNNEMAAAIGAISLACRGSTTDETRAMLNGVKARLESHAQLQYTLRRPPHDTWIDASIYFRLLCSAISESRLADTGIALEFVDRPVPMQAVLCWRLALIVSELIANAARHGFPDGTGRIRVELSLRDDATECRVTDNGVGSSQILPGVGLRIVEALAHGLGGTLRHHSGSHGTTWLVSVPSGAAVSDADGLTIALRRVVPVG
jgi:two-component sensor histidine kinase